MQSLGSLVAFQAMASVATTAIYIAYALPILFRVMLARKSFVPGPFIVLDVGCTLVKVETLETLFLLLNSPLHLVIPPPGVFPLLFASPTHAKYL